ncbi:MAG: stage II sporulation protein M [Clostridia bacterium]|nr:stage II sporulation protein M [Clostridia bacterium]
MKEDKFIKQNSETWACLEKTLNKLKSKGFQKFGKDELHDFINLYNLTCGHLSYCRTYYGNTNTTTYLNRLVASAHSYIYTTKISNVKKLWKFLVHDFPLLIRENIIYLIVSTSVFMLGFLISFIYTLVYSDNALAFVPQNIVESIDFNGNSADMWDSPVMSSLIFTNNIRVGFMAFALGITLGIGTVWSLVYNSFLLGSLGALAFHQSANLRFWSLILPHGVLELFAIFVAGAAGLIIGYSLINPGIYSRRDSFIIRGKIGIKLVCGTIPIFVIAGLIEGFITPSGISEIAKLSFALFTLIVLALYLVIPVLRHKQAVIKAASSSLDN